jgi:hypothetical protein
MDLQTERGSRARNHRDMIDLTQEPRRRGGLYLVVCGRTSQREPEMLLMKAVLEDAIRCFYKSVSGNTPCLRRLFAETKEWFFNDPRNGLFSFENICGVLSLRSEYIRYRLLRDEKARSTSVTLPQPDLLRHRPLIEPDRADMINRECS